MVKLGVSLVCLAAFVWFGTTVDLGPRTLFQHLRAIGESDESKELWRGASQKVGGVLGGADVHTGAEDKRKVKSVEVISEEQASAAEARAKGKGPAQEDLTDDDRRGMRHLIQSRAGHRR